MNKELEEAIKILKELKGNVALFSTGWKNILKQEEIKAIEKVLNYIDNSISKEELKKDLEMMKKANPDNEKQLFIKAGIEGYLEKLLEVK